MARELWFYSYRFNDYEYVEKDPETIVADFIDKSIPKSYVSRSGMQKEKDNEI